MSSFFEKLKKGMDIEGEIKEIKEIPGIEETEKPKEEKKPKEPKIAPKKAREIKTIKLSAPEAVSVKKNDVNEEEGQLAVDIFQTDKFLVVQSAVAGVKREDLEITMEKDVIVIKGERKNPGEEKADYFAKECFWGPVSRRIIAPVEVDPDSIEASMKEGVLTIKVPKILKEKKRKVEVEIKD